jgi:hypothetical protein
MSIIFEWNEDRLIMGHNKLIILSVSAGILPIGELCSKTYESTIANDRSIYEA